MLRPLDDEDEDTGDGEDVFEALAAADASAVVDAMAEEESDRDRDNREDEVAAVELGAADDVEVTPIVAASWNVLPEEQQLFSTSSPQHHEPSGHRESLALCFLVYFLSVMLVSRRQSCIHRLYPRPGSDLDKKDCSKLGRCKSCGSTASGRW